MYFLYTFLCWAKGQCYNPSNAGQPANNSNSATWLAVYSVPVVYGLREDQRGKTQVLKGSCWKAKDKARKDMNLLVNQVPPAFFCICWCPCFSFCSAQLPTGMRSPIVEYPPIFIHGRKKDRILCTSHHLACQCFLVRLPALQAPWFARITMRGDATCIL